MGQETKNNMDFRSLPKEAIVDTDTLLLQLGLPQRGLLENTNSFGSSYMGVFEKNWSIAPGGDPKPGKDLTILNSFEFMKKSVCPPMERLIDTIGRINGMAYGSFLKAYKSIEAGVVRKDLVFARNFEKRPFFLTFIPNGCFSGDKTDRKIRRVYYMWGPSKLVVPKTDTFKVRLIEFGFRPDLSDKTETLKNPELVFTMMFDPTKIPERNGFCTIPQDTYKCLRNPATLSVPKVCSITASESSQGKICDGLLKDLPYNAGDAEKRDFCARYPALQECKCLARAFDPIYQKGLDHLNISSVADACWWQPCKVATAGREIHITRDDAAKECPNELCVVINNIENVTDTDIAGLESNVSCLKITNDDGGGGDSTGGGGGSSTGGGGPSTGGGGPSTGGGSSGGGVSIITDKEKKRQQIIAIALVAVVVLVLLAFFGYRYIYGRGGKSKAPKTKTKTKSKPRTKKK